MNAAQHSARIALGVTGGIAAYKTAELVRLLTARGHVVFPIMTPWAARFIGPLTLETLSGNDVRIETPTGGEGIEHISLIRSVDLLLIAPLTANTMAKMAHGQADNFLTATYLAHRGMTLVCPAMNTAMLDPFSWMWTGFVINRQWATISPCFPATTRPLYRGANLSPFSRVISILMTNPNYGLAQNT